jgi:hypothetical protein
VFFDDILVYSRSEEEHLRLVLQKLRNHKSYAQLSMCEFWLKQVPFLGHVILKGGISMDPSKIEDVLSWKAPTNVRDILSHPVCKPKPNAHSICAQESSLHTYRTENGDRITNVSI